MNINQYRLINHDELEASANMAIDEAILMNCINCCRERSRPFPTLRFYKWQNPTLSLGYHQKLEEINIDECKKNNIDIVYRPTGGKAVLHKDELTYSFIGRNTDFGNTLFEIYKQINEALAIGLNLLGANVEVYQENKEAYFNTSACFRVATQADLCHKQKKLGGSAQLRRDNFFLQHGTILIKRDIDILKKILNLKDGEYEDLLKTTISLEEILNRPIRWTEVKDAIISGFEIHFKNTFFSDELNNYESGLINSLKDRFVIKLTQL